MGITLGIRLVYAGSMSDDKKPDLRIVESVKPRPGALTAKQQAFVREIVKGKLGSYKEAYAKVYDVTLNQNGSIPKWVEVEASKLVAHPKVALSIQASTRRREQGDIASALRTRNYVVESLYRESKESESDASRVRALELLGKSVAMFTEVTTERTARDTAEIEQDIEEKLAQLLAAADD